MGACLTPTGCVDAAVGSAVDAFWGGLATTVTQAAGQMVTTVFGWWTSTDTVSVDSVVVRTVQSYTLTWVAAPVAVLSLLATVTWGVAGTSPSWVRDVARGLLVFGVAAAASIPVVAALQDWAQALSTGLLAAVPTRDVGARFVTLLDLEATPPALVAFWGLLVLLAGAVQYVLMLFRDGAVLVLTVMVPVAAAGQFSRSSLVWLPRLAGWLVALVFTKPAGALVYFIGLSLLGGADGVQGLVTGLCVMIAAVAAMPVMLRLVTFATSTPLSGGLSSVATVTGLAASGAQVAALRRYAGVAAGPVGAAAVRPSAAQRAPRGVPRPARVVGRDRRARGAAAAVRELAAPATPHGPGRVLAGRPRRRPGVPDRARRGPVPAPGRRGPARRVRRRHRGVRRPHRRDAPDPVGRRRRAVGVGPRGGTHRVPGGLAVRVGAAGAARAHPRRPRPR